MSFFLSMGQLVAFLLPYVLFALLFWLYWIALGWIWIIYKKAKDTLRSKQWLGFKSGIK
jgi:uncharacterized membrane protein SpoIIM required for sporulation